MSGWMDICLSSNFFKSLLLLQFLSDSYDSWHTWSMCQFNMKWITFLKFFFKNFWQIFWHFTSAVEFTRPIGLSFIDVLAVCGWQFLLWHDSEKVTGSVCACGKRVRSQRSCYMCYWLSMLLICRDWRSLTYRCRTTWDSWSKRCSLACRSCCRMWWRNLMLHWILCLTNLWSLSVSRKEIICLSWFVHSSVCEQDFMLVDEFSRNLWKG